MTSKALEALASTQRDFAGLVTALDGTSTARADRAWAMTSKTGCAPLGRSPYGSASASMRTPRAPLRIA